MRAYTQACLATVHMLKLAHCPLDAMAFTLGRSREECDRASWALVGRSIPEAVAALNRPRTVGRAA